MADSLKVVEELKSVQATFIEKLEKQAAEIKAHGGTTAETSKELKSLEKRYLDLEAAIKHDIEESQKKAAEAVELATKAQARADELETKLKRPNMGTKGDHKSIGQLVAEGLVEQGFKRTNKSSDKVAVGDIWSPQNRYGRIIDKAIELKAITGDADMRDVVGTTRMPGIVADPVFRDVHIRDFLTVRPMTGNAVQWMRESSRTNNPGAQTEGQTKNLSDYGFEAVTRTASTIAHGTPINNQLLDDIPSLRSHIEDRLIQGLMNAEDVYILRGDGIAPNPEGIINDADVPTYNRHGYGGGSDTKLDTLRRGITQLRLQEYRPDLVIISVQDWEAIELLKDSEERYLWIPSVGEGGQPYVWRLPLLDTTAQEEGAWLMGNFRQGVALFDRQDYTVQAFNQHSDYALRNMTLLLAEGRIAIVVELPLAFINGTFLFGS